MFNLLSNASKFTPDGQITLRLDFSDPLHVRIIVEDEGIGMSEEEAAKI